MSRTPNLATHPDWLSTLLQSPSVFPAAEACVTLQLAVTGALTGLIWMVQLVHYPAFRFVDPGRFDQFQHFHMRRMSWLIAVLMPAEVLVAVGSAAHAALNWPSIWGKESSFWETLCFGAPFLGLVALGCIWWITFYRFVPIHSKLAGAGYDDQLIEKMVRSNWSRTGLWTFRLGLSGFSAFSLW